MVLNILVGLGGKGALGVLLLPMLQEDCCHLVLGVLTVEQQPSVLIQTRLIIGQIKKFMLLETKYFMSPKLMNVKAGLIQHGVKLEHLVLMAGWTHGKNTKALIL